MYSLVIVEDEKIARERLQHMIKWDELGFRVEATFADGQELLDYLKYNTVDVILTDIKMTHVSGLDIANYVAEHTLPIQVVLLSGYEEFEYAKRAIAYRVTDYLSKPVSIPKLKNTFQRIAEQLNKQNEQSLIRERQIQHYKQLINYEKQQFVTDVYYGAITSPKQIRKRLELLLGTNRQEKFFLLQLSLIRDSAYISVVENYGLDELQNQLQAHFTEDISLNSVAESVYLHPAYISRLIKERTGKTFSAFITDLRIEKALTLLENSNLHVYEIAERSGFNNLKYFYKVFREVTGKSPSDYRTTSKP